MVERWYWECEEDGMMVCWGEEVGSTGLVPVLPMGEY